MLGAQPFNGGCRFSVWAPNATQVFVVGTFNNWNKTMHLMESDKNGTWHCNVLGAQSGDEFKYRILNSEHEYYRNDPYARKVTHSSGNSVISFLANRQDIPDCDIPPLNQLIIYELHIGTFGRKEGQQKLGTIDGVIDRLPYLRDLGVNAIEIMPVMEFEGGFSWGYNPSNIFSIESDYGSQRMFKELVSAAHRLGIIVIVDVVYNHFGPGDLDLWKFDGWCHHNKGGIYFYNDWRSKTPWGDTRPDYGRGEVRQFIRDNALMWFNEYNIDGLRWDSVAYLRIVEGRNNDIGTDISEAWSLMQWINSEICQTKKSAISIAEDLHENDYITKPVNAGGAGFSSQWSAMFAHVLRTELIKTNDESRDMYKIQQILYNSYNNNAFQRIIYTESHDEVANGNARIPEHIDPGNACSWYAKKKAALGAVMVFTSPGIPMIFQGQEFLEDDWFHDKDPIDWSKRVRFSGILKLYSDLISLRLNKNGYTKGLTGQNVNVFHVNNLNKVVAFHRWYSGGAHDCVVVVLNFSCTTFHEYVVGLPATGDWKVLFNSDSKAYDMDFADFGDININAIGVAKDGLPAIGRVKLAPYSAIILQKC